MSTVASEKSAARPAESAGSPPGGDGRGDPRIVFRGVGVQVYEALCEATSEGEHVHLAYDGKDLEIMVVSNLHEIWKERLNKIVTALTLGRRIDYVSCGEATYQAPQRGLQADLTYYFDPEKIRAVRDAERRESTDPADYPSPDLAIEIDRSPPQIDRPEIYEALRVSEVWRFSKGPHLIIDHLQPDGSYAPAPASRFLHIRVEEILEWLSAEDVTREAEWHLRLIQWAMGLGRQG